MAQLQKIKFYAQERFVIPDLENLQDFIEEDFHLLNTNFWAATTQIVSGFTVNNLGGLGIEVIMAGSTLFNTSGTYKAFYVGEDTDLPLTETLADDSLNYVHIQVVRETGAQASRAFWDPTLKDSAGGEFIQDVNTAEWLTVQLYVSQVGWSSDTDKVQVALIKTGSAATPPVGSGTIGSIEDRRNMYFRLARGDDATYEFALSSLTDDDEDFTSADRELSTDKMWKDFVMTKFKKIQGTPSWWIDPPGSLATTLYALTDGGTWSWDIDTTPDLSAFTVGMNATIVDPAIPFITNGSATGAFDVASSTGLSIGQVISISDTTPDAKKVVITNITGTAPNITIQTETAELTFSADAYYVILGTVYTNYIRFATQSPIVLGPEYIAYVDLDLENNVDLSVQIVKDDNYINQAARFIIARRYSDTAYVG